MNEHDLTPWFDGKVKPARPGVYMQMSGVSLGYQYWDGRRWSTWCFTPENAYNQRRFLASSKYQNDPWRGLSRKPSK